MQLPGAAILMRRRCLATGGCSSSGCRACRSDTRRCLCPVKSRFPETETDSGAAGLCLLRTVPIRTMTEANLIGFPPSVRVSAHAAKKRARKAKRSAKAYQ